MHSLHELLCLGCYTSLFNRVVMHLCWCPEFLCCCCVFTWVIYILVSVRKNKLLMSRVYICSILGCDLDDQPVPAPSVHGLEVLSRYEPDHRQVQRWRHHHEQAPWVIDGSCAACLRLVRPVWVKSVTWRSIPCCFALNVYTSRYGINTNLYICDHLEK
jgi:hypothetical protein